MQIELQKMKIDVFTFRVERDKSVKASKELKEKLATSENTILKLNRDYFQHQREFTKTLATRMDDLTQARKEINELKLEIDSLTTKSKSECQKLKDAEDEARKLKDALEAVESDHAKCFTCRRTLEKEFSREKKSLKKEQLRLKAIMEEIENENYVLRTDQMDTLCDLERIRGERDDLRQAIAIIREEQLEDAYKWKENIRNIEVLKRDRDDLRRDRDEFRTESENVKLERDNLKAERDDCSDKMKVMQEDYRRARDESKREGGELKRLGDELRRERDELRKEAENLKLERDNLKAERDECRREGVELKRLADESRISWRNRLIRAFERPDLAVITRLRLNNNSGLFQCKVHIGQRVIEAPGEFANADQAAEEACRAAYELYVKEHPHRKGTVDRAMDNDSNSNAAIEAAPSPSVTKSVKALRPRPVCHFYPGSCREGTQCKFLHR
jgi:chromosome segregation ATPase